MEILKYINPTTPGGFLILGLIVGAVVLIIRKIRKRGQTKKENGEE